MSTQTQPLPHQVPRQLIRDFLKSIEDPRGWKYPIPARRFEQKDFALEVAAAMEFYYGGYELSSVTEPDGTKYWLLSSRGYYHYVGA